MVKHVQELIDKIKQEGLEAAEKKAQDIERLAKLQGEKIIKDAEKKAQAIIAQAQAQAQKLEDSAKASIQQASRDVLLTLKQEILGLLQGIVLQQVGSVLTPEVLAELIKAVATKSLDASSSRLLIELNPKDVESFAGHAVAQLQKAIKKEIVLKPADDVSKGFRISFDEGKSSFDFSDQSLTAYMSTLVNPQIAGLLQSTTTVS